MDEGWQFTSDTDTEVVAHLIELAARGRSATRRWRAALPQLEGMFAFAVVSVEAPEPEIVVARNGPPLVLGLGDGEQFLASDPAALLSFTRDVVFLENGDMARLRAGGVELSTAAGAVVERSAGAAQLGPDPGREGRLQALHAQGDPRAAAGDPGHLRRPRGLRGAARRPRRLSSSPAPRLRGGRAHPPAGLRHLAGTPAWSASS